jgi:hypothetical protein
MFNKNFNIIIGKRVSGRTLFLWKISKMLKSFGYKICFIGCTSEFNQTDPLLNHFDFCRILSQRDDTQTTKMIKEITERDKYDFIFIDDIDCTQKPIQKILNSINIRKIATCLDIAISNSTLISEVFNDDSNMFNIKNIYNNEPFDSSTIIEYKNNKHCVSDLLISLARDLKINNILE